MPFQFTPYTSPLTASIADRLAQRGAIEAQRAYATGTAAANAAVQSGNAWAGAVQGVGQTIGALPGQIAAVTRSNTVDQLNQIKLADARREQQGQQAVANLMQGDQAPPDAVGPRQPSYLDEHGLFDVPKLTARLAATGFGDQAPALVQGAERINESIQKAQAQKQQTAQQHAILFGHLANGALELAKMGTPLDQAMDVVVQPVLVNGLVTPQEYATVKAQIGALPPADQQAALTGLMNTAARLAPTKTLGKDQVEHDIFDRVVASNLVPDKPTEASLAADAATLGTPQETPTAAQSKTALGTLQAPTLAGREETARHNQELERIAGLTQGREVARDAETRRHHAAIEAQTVSQSTDVQDAVAAMKAGAAPPLLPGRASKEYVAMIAEAKRQGFDLAGAATDWTATQKHIAALNGAQQLRLNQSVNALPELLDSVDGLAAKWNAGSFPVLNKANLALAKSGVYGKDAATIANQLDAQIADVTADLGNVYMGGNSPTDHALGLASKSLSADWDATVLHNMVDLARQNVAIRQHSMRNTGVAGASEGNRYAPPAAAAPAATSGRQRVVGPNGEAGTVATGTALPPGWKVQ